MTLQCQKTDLMMASVMFALLKPGAPEPADVRRPSGTWLTSPSGLCEPGTVAATVYYQAEAPFWASQPSNSLKL